MYHLLCRWEPHEINEHNKSITGKCKKHNCEVFWVIAQKHNRLNGTNDKLRPRDNTVEV